MHDFSPALLVTAILTALGGVVIVLTRVRLHVSHRVTALSLHTWCGVIALATWTTFLIAPTTADWSSIVGVVGLGCWWVVACCGLVILVRWRTGTGKGKRAADAVAAADSWSSTPWLSLAAHFGMFSGVAWFTIAYVTSVI